MASVMAICGGLVRPKSENVKKPLVLSLFLEGQGAIFRGSRSFKSFGRFWVGLARRSDMLRGEDIGGVQRIII